MGKGSKENDKKMKEKAKSRVDELQGMFGELECAIKESRLNDVSILQHKVHHMLNDWKSELNEPSPASSLHEDAKSLGDFSSEIYRLLHLGEEEDDATSILAASKPDPNAHKVATDSGLFKNFNMSQGPYQTQEFQFHDQSYDLHREAGQTYSGFVDLDQGLGYLPNICPPPSAFLGPKCSLWDCTRPAQGFDYCSSHHAALALEEGPPGMSPVLRPGGIGLKDGLLFDVLKAKSEAKDVGVPECEGAATSKSPWNAPELFDLTVLEGEAVREWLFFDKPRKAFDSGTRKQRALPDYTGRGWHESRKQVMNEFRGLKRSYYMDPQPRKDFEWHLFEYVIDDFDACALYRLEFKRIDGKKSPKGKSPSGKSPNDSVADLQKQMQSLTAEVSTGNKPSGKGRAKASPSDGAKNTYSAPHRVGLTSEESDFGMVAVDDYLVADLNGYYCNVAGKP